MKAENIELYYRKLSLMLRILNYITGNDHESWEYWIILQEMNMKDENIELNYWRLPLMLRILNYTTENEN